VLYGRIIADDAQQGTFSALADLPDGGTISTLASGTPNASNGGASEVVISADGRFAYAAVRYTGKDNGPPAAPGAEPDSSGWGTFNQIAVLSLDEKSGAAQLVSTVPSGGNMPWTHQLIANDSLLVSDIMLYMFYDDARDRGRWRLS
jgi:6-phosphogluconolactonase (cycloisomerase 2 family)